MRIVIIGAGNVATILGKMAKTAGHDILQVISRKSETAETLAGVLQCNFTSNFSDIDKTGQLFLVAMSDAALNELKENIKLGDKVIVHTAGAVPMDVLKGISENYGIVYPLQSLRKEKEYTSNEIPLLIDGNNSYTLSVAETFARSICTNVTKTDDDKRLKLHLAAVIASNFVNHLYCVAEEYCQKENVDFKMLLPLIEETATRLKKHTPLEMQTGPAVRKDIVTLEKHLRLLTTHPKLKTLYLRMTDSIMNP